MTFGENRVRTQFNVSNDTTVQHIKERAAEFMNYVNDNVYSDGADEEKTAEIVRLKEKALDAIESASMWAVKAATV